VSTAAERLERLDRQVAIRLAMVEVQAVVAAVAANRIGFEVVELDRHSSPARPKT